MPTASFQRGKTTPNKCPGYDSKPSDGEALALDNVDYPFIAITSRSNLTQSGSTC